MCLHFECRGKSCLLQKLKNFDLRLPESFFKVSSGPCSRGMPVSEAVAKSDGRALDDLASDHMSCFSDRSKVPEFLLPIKGQRD